MDKPYTERTGGSYVRDRETGTLKRAEPERRRQRPAPADQRAAGTPEAPSVKTEKRGK